MNHCLACELCKGECMACERNRLKKENLQLSAALAECQAENETLIALLDSFLTGIPPNSKLIPQAELEALMEVAESASAYIFELEHGESCCCPLCKALSELEALRELEAQVRYCRAQKTHSRIKEALSNLDRVREKPNAIQT